MGENGYSTCLLENDKYRLNCNDYRECRNSNIQVQYVVKEVIGVIKSISTIDETDSCKNCFTNAGFNK